MGVSERSWQAEGLHSSLRIYIYVAFTLYVYDIDAKKETRFVQI